MRQKLIIATKNPGKIREIRLLLSHLSYTVFSLNDSVSLPKEIGNSYEENAFLKAQYIGDLFGKPTIADDSGIEISALPGKLGIHSAREFLGSAQEINKKILEKLRTTQDRSAQFITCVVLYSPKTKRHWSFWGKLVGEIATEQKTTENEGFGFDPIFIPKGYTKTFAELGIDLKNIVSHRAIALRKLTQFLQKNTIEEE